MFSVVFDSNFSYVFEIFLSLVIILILHLPYPGPIFPYILRLGPLKVPVILEPTFLERLFTQSIPSLKYANL